MSRRYPGARLVKSVIRASTSSDHPSTAYEVGHISPSLRAADAWNQSVE
ncbi:hypothetical protein [Humibacter ginsenosidimutans]|nr:hypothetical protein [Humibacter ginsenosidimutans]